MTPGRHARPAGDVDDRQEAAPLDVQRAAAGAAVGHDEVAEEARRRLGGDGHPGQSAHQRPVVRRARERPGERGRRRRPRPTPAGRRPAPRPGSAPSPARDRSSHDRSAPAHAPAERANSGRAAVAPWAQPGIARHLQPVDHPSAARRSSGSRTAGSSPSPAHACALSESDDGTGSRRALLPRANQVKRCGRRAELLLGQLQQAPRGGVVHRADHPADRRRLDAGVVKPDHGVAQPAGDRRQLFAGSGVADLAAEQERRPPLDGDQVGVGDDADHVAPGVDARGGGGGRAPASPAARRRPSSRR